MSRSRRQPLVLGVAVTLLSGTCAWADQSDILGPLSLRFSETVSRDNNVYRLPEGTTSPGPRQDTTRTSTLGFSLDKAYGLQALHLAADFADIRYQSNGSLTRQTKNGDAGWNWTLTPELVGTLTASRTQSQNSFAEFANAAGSINTSDSVAASVDFGGAAPVHLIGAVSHVTSSNSVLLTQTGNTSTHTGQVGVRYQSAAGNSITYLLRDQRIDWIDQALDPVNLFDTHANQLDHEVQLHWLPTATSTLDLVVTHLSKRYEHFQARDYSGTAGSINLGWQATAQVQVALGAQRSYSTWLNSFSSYSVTDRVFLRPSWQFSPKASLSLSFYRSTIDYLGPVVPQVQPLRQDRMPSAEIGLNWSPLRNLSLSATWHREHRESNQPGADYADSLGTLQATLRF